MNERVIYFVAAQDNNKVQSFRLECDANKPIEEVWESAIKQLNDPKMVFTAFNRL